jgi:hypothetical protein
MQVLGRGRKTRVVAEADNEDKYPAAIHAKHRLGRYPVLGPGEDDRAYRRLWEWIFDGAHEGRRSLLARQMLGPGIQGRIFDGRPDTLTWLAGTIARDPRPRPTSVDGGDHRRVVAKSIHAQLALDWLVSAFDVDVLVLLRHPANVLASWMEVNLKDSRNSTLETRPEIRSRYLDRWDVPLPGPEPLERMCWRIGLLVAALEESAAWHPTFQVRTHEALCTDPVGEFRRVFADFGMEWTQLAEDFLRDHDQPGEGFVVKRVAADLPDSWQRRLDDHQLSTLRKVLSRFPITTWSDDDFERSE